MVKLHYDPKMKNPKGSCVVMIHASWCGHCKILKPKFENDIVTSDDFSKELDGLLTLGSIEEADYNDAAKKIFGNVDGYPTIRYIRFDQNGKAAKSFDLPSETPREAENIIEWINSAVKNDAMNNVVKVRRRTKSKTNSKKIIKGGKRKIVKTVRKKLNYKKFR
jgi:thiol-disulfide isomerase/thioredoxin